jgi:hypothetical protein
MVASKSAFTLLLLASLSQSTAFRAHRSDSDFVPVLSPSRAAANTVKQSDVAEPLVGSFGVSGKFTSFRQAFASVRMSAEAGSTEGANTDGEDSMKDLAAAALDSGGDPAKIATGLDNLSDTNKKKFALTKQEVLAKAKTMAGVSGPLGFFDPIGFCSDCSEGKLCFYREVEVKHGRVGMLASVGFLVAEQFHPLFGGNVDVPSYIAFQQTPLQTFWPVVVAAIAIPEVFSVFSFQEPWATEFLPDGKVNSATWTVRTDREPGDLGFDPLGLKPKDPEGLKKMQTKELNNGRLAMLAAAGMIAQELATGQKILA